MRSRHELREELFAAGSVDGAVGVLAGALGEFGVGRFITGYVGGEARVGSGRWRTYKHRSFRFPEGWDEAWHLYNPHCPYYHACFDGRAAFDWATVRGRQDLSQREVKAWNYLADFGLVRGFTVPIHAPGHFGFVTVVGETEDRAWDRHIEAHAAPLLFLSHVFHEAVRERYPEFFAAGAAAGLSGRERECLRGAAAGLTSKAMAAALGLSEETVRVYLKRAMRKLDAANRAQAVARAYRAGLID
ncbi:MAG: autoinducer binding domain-containing protein [Dongiaceae bacterium]